MDRSVREGVDRRLEEETAGQDVVRWHLVAEIDELRLRTDAEHDPLHDPHERIPEAKIGQEGHHGPHGGHVLTQPPPARSAESKASRTSEDRLDKVFD
jgi:hypothetical protein